MTDISKSGTPFALGEIVHTPAAIEAIGKAEGIAGESALDAMTRLLSRHQAGNWGAIGAEDAATNDTALVIGERLRSAYDLADGTTVWVITERDRSFTILLLPEESQEQRITGLTWPGGRVVNVAV